MKLKLYLLVNDLAYVFLSLMSAYIMSTLLTHSFAMNSSETFKTQILESLKDSNPNGLLAVLSIGLGVVLIIVVISSILNISTYNLSNTAKNAYKKDNFELKKSYLDKVTVKSDLNSQKSKKLDSKK